MILRRWGWLLLAAVAAVVMLPAGPVAAHAVLEETDPVSGAVLDETPAEVILRFNEPVSAALGGIRVLDAAGERVDAGAPRLSGDGRTLTTPLEPVADGIYVVAYRIISADSHPIRGAFTFRVGEAPAGDDRELIQDVLASEGGAGRLTGSLYGVARFGAFAGLAVLVGGAAFLAVCWPAGAGSARARKILWGAWGVLVGSTVLGIVTHGPYAAGLPLADGFKPSLIGDVLDTRFGTVWGARLILLLAAVPVLLRLRPRPPAAGTGAAGPPPWLLPAGAVLGAALLFTPALAGHAITGDLVPLAVAADVAHVGAIAFWLGGLVLVCAALLPGRDVAVMRVVLPRFSRAALGAVTVILATGTFLSWRQVRQFEALTGTTYGRLVLTKVALFAGIIAVAALSRQLVRGRLRLPARAVPVPAGPGALRAEPEREAAHRLRRTVFAEVALAVAVLAVTSALVNSVPAREAVARPYSALIEAEDLLVDVTVEPARRGPNDFHFYTLDATGMVTEVAELEARLILPAQDLGPLPVELTRITGDHYSAYGFDIPIPGEWRLEIIARPTEFDRIQATTTFTVR